MEIDLQYLNCTYKNLEHKITVHMNPICTVRLHEMHIGWRFISLTELEKTIT